ncbi:MAG: DNA gyrase C-terminal beta-propeller domain-containing protein, partial [Acidobacteriota bacterium]
RSGLRAITIKGDDRLEWVAVSSGKDEIFLVTKAGQAIRFSEKDVRAMGRSAAGVIAMRLKKDDEIVSMHVIEPKVARQQQALVITEHGFGKRTPLSEYRLQGRGGSGIKTASITAKTGKVVNASIIHTNDAKNTDLLIISEKGQVIRVNADSVSKQGRLTQGVRVMRAGDKTGQVATFTTWQNE